MEEFNPFSLNGKSILVTGASSGIGKTIAITCAKMGATVIATARNVERLKDTLGSMPDGDHKVITAELTKDEDVNALVEQLPKLDGVVYCAGTQNSCITKMLDRDSLNSVFETNFFAVCSLNKTLLSKKKVNKGASMVFISSAAAHYVAEIGNAAYSASKGALSSFARVLAMELVPRKIRVNTVTPGMVRTPLMEKFAVSQEEFAEDEKKYPLGYGEPDDVANGVIYLLSDASKWVTGTNILLDGGLTLH